jgi:TetR/AcrR family transcriptional repressor of uid operon
VLESFERLLHQARDEGRINPTDDPAIIARIISLIGDGIFWQRAFDKKFNPAEVIPTILSLVSGLINPVETASSRAHEISEGDHKSDESNNSET